MKSTIQYHCRGQTIGREKSGNPKCVESKIDREPYKSGYGKNYVYVVYTL